MDSLLDVIISGIGLTTDMYDFQVINNVKRLLEKDHADGGYGDMSHSQKGLLTSSALIGAVFGMLFFGSLADRCGRRTGFICTATLTALGSILSACAWDNGHGSIYTLLIAFRFLMGFGIGGEYPISASHTAESSHSESSGVRMVLVYACMGLGYVLAPLAVYICIIAGASPEFTWRFAFGLGGAISVSGLLLRLLKMKNSERFERAAEAETNRREKRSTFSILSAYWKPLLGTCGSWFLYDVVDYGLGLYSDEVTNIVEQKGDAGAVLNVLLINTICLPSFFLSAWVLTKMGRKRLQIFGFAGMMAAFVAIFALYPTLTSDGYGWLFIALYCTQLSFDNMGPGASTFVIPGEIFPTTVRATGHGLSAASGKVGAFVGTYFMPYLIDDGDHKGLLGVRWTMLLMACICALCILWTVLLTPSYDARTLEKLEGLYEEGDQRALITWLYGGANRERERESSKVAPLTHA